MCNNFLWVRIPDSPELDFSDVMSYSDYYPFGAPMSERTWSANYRYGFNGKEKDSEVQGAGNSYDFGSRMYDGRLGKWLTLDPLTRQFPYNSPYQYAANSPLLMIDRDGSENIIYLIYIAPSHNEKPRLSLKDIRQIKKDAEKKIEMMALKTKVVIFESKEPFNPANIDEHDTFLLIGDASDCKEYWDKNIQGKQNVKPSGRTVHFMGVDSKHIVQDLDCIETAAEAFGIDNPEFSSSPANGEGGLGAIVASDRLKTYAGEIKQSISKTGALVALHVSYGHNSNTSHRSSVPLAQTGCEIKEMLNPSTLGCVDEFGASMDRNIKPMSYDAIFFESSMDKTFYSKIQDRFGIEVAKDNYETNKNRHQEDKK